MAHPGKTGISQKHQLQEYHANFPTIRLLRLWVQKSHLHAVAVSSLPCESMVVEGDLP